MFIVAVADEDTFYDQTSLDADSEQTIIYFDENLNYIEHTVLDDSTFHSLEITYNGDYYFTGMYNYNPTIISVDDDFNVIHEYQIPIAQIGYIYGIKSLSVINEDEVIIVLQATDSKVSEIKVNLADETYEILSTYEFIFTAGGPGNILAVTTDYIYVYETALDQITIINKE